MGDIEINRQIKIRRGSAGGFFMNLDLVEARG